MTSRHSVVGQHGSVSCPAMAQTDEWTVERHLVDLPESVIDLYEHFVEMVSACGPFDLSVTKTAIAFKGPRRGFAGAKPRRASFDGFLDLQRQCQGRKVSPGLAVHEEALCPSVPANEPRAARRILCWLGPGGIRRRVRSPPGVELTP